MQILVVDDFATGRLTTDAPRLSFDSFGRMLRRAGATIDVRASAHQARQRLLELTQRGELPDVLLTDYYLSGRETGLDLACWCMQQPALARIARVLLSAAVVQAERAAVAQATSLHAVFVAVYEKPVDMMTLVHDLARLITLPPAGSA